MDILFIAAVFVTAGLVKGVTGMGLPTVAIALLSLRMPPLQAAALLIVPSSVTNVWQLASGPSVYPLWQRFRWVLLSMCAGVAIAFVLGSATWNGAVLGGALAAYGLLGLTGWRMRVAPRCERWAGPLVGVVTGLLGGVTGVFVMPAAPYLQALNLEREDLLQAMGMAFTVGTLSLAVMLALRSEWHVTAAGNSALALIPTIAGMLLGQKLRGRMAPAMFRRCFFLALLALGVHQLLR
ncbi:TSUP family transporter [Duganella sp. FT50W]|uniref:Probable membrane transporter protein n=1 Tax=Duganella lactea TaxID=2692173 RepID=A0A6L8MHZ4_9BURK|nr:sulfite exporter TauE/SafE family protein [Duganella lactea]MYM36341.1 TSUP family transporter [Duganella lactea]MYM81512.1 TSUP family transporter [Duganella lactea]